MNYQNLTAQKRRFNGRNNAFSLIEIIAVIAIVSVLALLSIHAVLKAFHSSKVKKAETDIAKLNSAVKELIWDTGYWPGSSTRISSSATNYILFLDSPQACLIENPWNHPNWDGPYIDYVPKDPWGHSYFFQTGFQPGGSGNAIPVIGSFGKNAPEQTIHKEEFVYIEIIP